MTMFGSHKIIEKEKKKVKKYDFSPVWFYYKIYIYKSNIIKINLNFIYFNII